LNRRRSLKLLEALLDIADPQRVGELLKKYRGMLFPEQLHDDLRDILRSRKFFEKIRNKKFEMRLQ